jgi:hypothetical protein
MSKTGKWIALAAACVAFNVGVAAAADEKPANVAGDWELTIQSPRGTRTPTVTLQQDGGALTGMYHSQRGDAPLSGTVKGKEVDFTVKLSMGGRDLAIEYVATVDGGNMTGKVQLGERGDQDFTGTKK